MMWFQVFLCILAVSPGFSGETMRQAGRMKTRKTRYFGSEPSRTTNRCRQVRRLFYGHRMKPEISPQNVADCRMRADGSVSHQDEPVTVNSAPTGDDAQSSPQQLSVSIFVININGNGADISDLINQVISTNTNPDIIALEANSSVNVVRRSIDVELNSDPSKDEGLLDLLQLIKFANPPRAKSEVEKSDRSTEKKNAAGRGKGQQSGAQQNHLTPRERGVLELVALGFGNKEIAELLKISLYTVKNHVHNILEKLQVKYRKEAILYAYEIGLIDQRSALSAFVLRNGLRSKGERRSWLEEIFTRST